jgi:hygromycin-B 4-O-kinase
VDAVGLGEHSPAHVSSVEAVGHGEWSRAFAWGDYVVRFSAFDEDFRKDQLAARHATDVLPIPAILELGEAFGGFYAISRRATGRFLDELDDASLRQVLPALFGALDAARLVDLSATRGYGGWRGDGNAPHSSWRAALLDVGNDRPESRCAGWRRRLASAEIGLGPFEEAYGALSSLVSGVPEARHLVHSDLLNFNVLVDGRRVSAVLDWGSSMYGDFLLDVAWLTFWQPWYPAWAEIDLRAEALRHYAQIGLEVPNFNARLRCYEVWIGLDNQAYSAFKSRWGQLEEVAERTLAIARN